MLAVIIRTSQSSELTYCIFQFLQTRICQLFYYIFTTNQLETHPILLFILFCSELKIIDNYIAQSIITYILQLLFEQQQKVSFYNEFICVYFMDRQSSKDIKQKCIHYNCFQRQFMLIRYIISFQVVNKIDQLINDPSIKIPVFGILIRLVLSIISYFSLIGVGFLTIFQFVLSTNQEYCNLLTGGIIFLTLKNWVQSQEDESQERWKNIFQQDIRFVLVYIELMLFGLLGLCWVLGYGQLKYFKENVLFNTYFNFFWNTIVVFTITKFQVASTQTQPAPKITYPILKNLYPILKDLYPILKHLYPILKDLYSILKHLYSILKNHLFDFMYGNRQNERAIDGNRYNRTAKYANRY